MAKFSGKVGFVDTIPVSAGVYEEQLIERPYFGDVIRNIRRLEPAEGLNDNLALNNSISIVADAYAMHNYFAIRYVEWMGAKWKVTAVEVLGPRLLLNFGGVYNGQTPN